MEINVDEVLRDIGAVAPQSEASVVPRPTEESAFSDDDINDILQENGFSEDTSSEVSTEDTDDIDRVIENADNEDLNINVDPLEETEEEEENAEETTPVGEALAETIDESAKIPLNSPTLLMDESTTRFSGAEWFKEIQKARVIIAGIGGIGSNVVFQLARMVPANITMYDDDIVETVNMAGQLYSYDDIGKAKVNAMADMITKYTSMRQINAVRGKFTESTEPGDIMICGFDNMVARKTFFNSWTKHISSKSDEERAKCLYLDGRLSMDTLQILCIKGDDVYNILRYKKEFLFKDSEAEATVCSMKQTTYLACMIGSLMVNLFTNFIAGLLNPIIPYDLPFFTEYDAQNMLFKTEN